MSEKGEPAAGSDEPSRSFFAGRPVPPGPLGLPGLTPASGEPVSPLPQLPLTEDRSMLGEVTPLPECDSVEAPAVALPSGARVPVAVSVSMPAAPTELPSHATPPPVPRPTARPKRRLAIAAAALAAVGLAVGSGAWFWLSRGEQTVTAEDDPGDGARAGAEGGNGPRGARESRTRRRAAAKHKAAARRGPPAQNRR